MCAFNTQKITNLTNMSDTIYIIGNGPSLNKVDISKLKNKDTISFNRAYIAYKDWGFYPKYYMVVDKIVLQNTREKVKELIETTPIERFFLPQWSKEYFGENEKICYLNFRKSVFLNIRFWGNRFSRMGIISNVGATSVPVLKILGYKNYIILGTDCNYVESGIKNVEIEHNPDDKQGRRIVYKSSADNDPNHFRPDYFGKGTEYSKPQQVNHFKGWEYISKKMKSKKIKIILCSPGSTLSALFKVGEFEEIIKKY
jgi:hypothetical protein